MLKTKWEKPPSHYSLLTNVKLTTKLRNGLMSEFNGLFKPEQIHLLGADDICDLLDLHPNLRKSFPELMGIRDLESYLLSIVNHEIFQRSKAAIVGALEVAKVFVYTNPYSEAYKTLEKHNFAVLDGPPEMGKTSIARMIGLSQVASKWSTCECYNPAEFFKSYLPGEDQVFIFDDAFGRTEFDPSLGRNWEKDLPNILNHLDKHHWLIITSRTHILIRALKAMDLEGKAGKFPEHSEVTVLADKLTVEEKARMLYRHGKVANLSDQHKKLIKSNANEIVKAIHFTPERIRRFVFENLPEIEPDLMFNSNNLLKVKKEVIKAIENPTERMRRAFDNLSSTHQWILIAYLESYYYCSEDSLYKIVLNHMDKLSKKDFKSHLDDLEGTFLKKWDFGLGNFQYSWIHPSYRDLVIDKLTDDNKLQSAFLKSVSTGGIKLALSSDGGDKGERSLPFMHSKENWDLLADGCEKKCVTGSADEIKEILIALDEAILIEKSSKIISSLKGIIKNVCCLSQGRWNTEGEILSVDILEAYSRCSVRVSPIPPFPDLEKSLNVEEAKFDAVLRDFNLFDSEELEFIKLALLGFV